MALGVGQSLSQTPGAQAATRVLEAVRLSRPRPNEVIRVACIGLRSRGCQHLMGIEAVPGAAVVAGCDTDQSVLHTRAEEFQQRTGRTLRLYEDYRRLMDDPQIDAVAIATCNHTHAIIALAAMEAGKDVYVEKPCSHNLFEGQQLVRAAEKYQRICQHGTQSRSCPAVQEAIHYLHKGLIGEVALARVRCWSCRPQKLPRGEEPVPAGVNYDLWLGPAPLRPFNRNRFHSYWRWSSDYGNGDLGNQAVHLLDLARWGLNVTWPQRIRTVRNPLLLKEYLQPTPCSQAWLFEFPKENKTLILEIGQHRAAPFPGAPSNILSEGVVFYGSEGILEMDYFGYRTFLGRSRQQGPQAQAPPQEFERFIQAIATRRSSSTRRSTDSDPDIQQGHCSSGLGHLAYIACRLNRTLEFDPVAETLVGDAEADRLLSRNYRMPFVVRKIV